MATSRRVLHSIGVALFATAGLLLTNQSVLAGTEVVAVTGDAAPGAAGAKLGSIAAGSINDAGEVVFRATLQEGFGGVSSTNDAVVWRLSESTKAIIAREGVVAPGGGTYSTFSQATLDDAGNVALRATLSAGQVGTWRLTAPGSGAVVARTEDLAVPDLPSARFQNLDFRHLQSSNNVVPWGASLLEGAGGVSTADRRGIWIDDAIDSTLIARSNTTETPGIGGGKFSNLVASAVNGAAQVAVIGVMRTDSGGVSSSNNVGIWRLTAGGGTLVARRGVGAVPGVAGASFEQFQDPVINSTGQLAFDALLLGGVRGVWRYDGGVGALLARTGAGVAAGTTGALYADFSSPVLNDAGQSLIKGTLAAGVGDAVSGNEVGLWLAEPGESTLLARIGSGGVPGIVGASFAAFTSMSLNSEGIAAVAAELSLGPGGVSTGNEHGIWLLDAVGGSQLIARTGDVLSGRTIASLEMLGDSGGADGRARSLNNIGQLAFKAAFTDGVEAMMLYTPESTTEYAANFDGDDDVDGADLTRWRTNFGAGPSATKAQGDADLDGDVDGADFLVWQREVTGPLSSVATVQPVLEPTSGLLTLAAATAAAASRRRAIASAVRRR